MATGTESLWQKSKFKIETLILGSTTVTATGSELNILSGVTATAAEINAAADVSGVDTLPPPKTGKRAAPRPPAPEPDPEPIGEAEFA